MELWRVFILFYEKIGGSMKTNGPGLTVYAPVAWDCGKLDRMCDCKVPWWLSCKYIKENVQEQNKGGYSDCRNPAFCTYCGGNCPYNTDSVETVGSS
jgi:hypothetical protein